jgi:uncharacterized protein DUF6113
VPRSLRLLCYVVLVPLAVVVAVCGAFTQQHMLYAGGVSWPLGALLALAACAGLFIGGTTLTGTALGAGLPTLVWLATVIALTYGGDGDVILPNSVSALLFLFGGTILGGGSAMSAHLVVTRRRILEAQSEAAADRRSPGARPARTAPDASDRPRKSNG